jgi:hypothetical protein
MNPTNFQKALSPVTCTSYTISSGVCRGNGTSVFEFLCWSESKLGSHHSNPPKGKEEEEEEEDEEEEDEEEGQ